MKAEKKLTLLRHGEAALGMGQAGDLKRNLTPNGKAQLARLRELLKNEGVTFDFAAFSPATRCQESLEIINTNGEISKIEKYSKFN